MVCSWHDVCANCYVLNRYTGSHTQQHGTMLLEKSGTLPKPPPLPVRPTSRLPTYPAQPPQPARPSTDTPPQFPQQPPPPARPTKFSPAQSSPPLGTPQVQRKPLQNPPRVGATSPTANTAEPTNNAGNSTAGGQQGWKPLFQGSNPLPTALALFNAVFDCLDTLKVGILAPEQYSAFCDVQGYLQDEDVWKRSNKPTFGSISEDLADYELRTVYENFSIEHVLQDRIAPPNNDMAGLVSSMSGLMGSGLANSLSSSLAIPRISGGKMPMLTRKGFIDITTIEIVGVPSIGWQRINRMTRHYRLQGPWSQWGDCPREMLPEEAPQDVTDRIHRIAAFSKKQAEERIEAKRVEMALRAQGRQNALELLDPPGTRYYYRY